MRLNLQNQGGGFRNGRAPRLFILLGCIMTGAGLVAPKASWAQTSTDTGHGVHYRWSQQSPPGMIGSWQLQRGVGPRGYAQPVRVVCPPGVTAHFGTGSMTMPLSIQLAIGQVHRFQITGLPDAPGESLWPSIEIIDRLHPPVGSEEEFPILVVIEPEEIEAAKAGALVTKVIYLEQPDLAISLDGSQDRQEVYEVGPNRNPIQVADVLGRPVAILRMGSWAPEYEIGRSAEAMPGASSINTVNGGPLQNASVVPARYQQGAPGRQYGIPMSQARDRLFR